LYRYITMVTDAAAALAYVRSDGDARMIPTSLENSDAASAGARMRAAAMPAFPSGSATAASSSGRAAASHVVQRLVPRPLLVNGVKVDLRTYVFVTSWGGGGGGDDGGGGGGGDSGGSGGNGSGGGGDGGGGGGGVGLDSDAKVAEQENIAAHVADEEEERKKTSTSAAAQIPPRAYLYDEGLVRFAATSFDASDTSPARHLTNNALAKTASTSHSDGSDAHFKNNWSLAQLRTWLDKERGGAALVYP
jgi:hypothetical protein